MSTQKIIGVGVIVFIVLIGGWFVFSSQNSEDTMMQKDDEAMEEKADAIMGDKDGETMMDKDEGMMKAGSYEAYSPEKLALASEGDVFIFFHATWCPICRGIESEIKADPSRIPPGVHILKIDYDNATALRQKYGVTVQHTFVQVDAQGNPLQKFSDASKLSDVLGRVK